MPARASLALLLAVTALGLVAPAGARAGFGLTELPASPLAAGTNPGGTAIADFDGDEIPDLVTTDTFTSTVAVERGTGSGAFLSQASPTTGLGGAPLGIATGDFNEDSKPDLVVANSGTNQVAVLLNTSSTGSVTFSAAVPYPVGTSPQVPVVGDFDRDGNQDVAVANAGSDNVSALLGNGGGALGAAVSTGVGDDPRGLAVADLDSDGKDDLVAADYAGGTPGSGSHAVLINMSPAAGTASFGVTITLTTAANGFSSDINPYSVALTDFSLEGNIDMVLADPDTDQVTELTGVGGGAFFAPTNFSVEDQPRSVTTGDLNSDGKTDIVVPNAGSGTITVMIGRGLAGGAGFTNSHTQPVGADPRAAAVGDLDNDGIDDLAVANRGGGTTTLLGNRAAPGGALVWANKTSAAGGTIGHAGLDGTNPDPALKRTAADANHVAVDASHIYWTAGNFVGRMNLDGSNAQPTFITSANPVNGVAVNGTHIYWSQSAAGKIGRANLDGTGGNDSFATGLTSPQGLAVTADDADLYWAINAGVGHAAIGSGAPLSVLEPFITGGGQTFGVAVDAAHVYFSNFGGGDIGRADLDGGNVDNSFVSGSSSTAAPIDVAVDAGYVYWTNSITSLGNNFASIGRAQLAQPAAVTQRFVRLRPSDNPSGLAVLPTRGFASFRPSTAFSMGAGPRAVGTGDFDNDGDPDVVTAEGSGTVSVARGDGAGALEAATTVGTGPALNAVAVADFDGDGHPDVAAAEESANFVDVRLNSTSGPGNIAFGSPAGYSVGSNPTAMAVGDFDENGRPDLVTATDAGTVSVRVNDNGAGFIAKASLSAGGSPSGVAAGLIDADAHLDLAVTDLDGSVRVYLGGGDGTFTDAPTTSAGVQPRGLAIADLNGDGSGDLVVANSVSNDTSVLIGNGDGTFGAARNYASGLNPRRVVAADFNGDGRIDFATTQAGAPGTVWVRLNTGAPAGIFGAPTVLAVGNGPGGLATADFDHDARPDIVAADSGSNQVSLLRAFTALPFAPVARRSNPPSPANDNTPQIVGDADSDPETGLSIFNNATCSGGPTGSGTATTFKTSGIAVFAPDDATTSYRGTTTDEGGNVSPCSGPLFSYTEDSTPPAIPSGLSTAPSGGSSSDLAPEVNGITDLPTTIDVYLTNDCTGPATTGPFGAGFNGGITVTVPPNAVSTITTRARDIADNPSDCSAPITYSTLSSGPTAPPTPIGLSLTPPGPADDNHPKISGTTAPGTSIAIYDNPSCSGAPVASGPAGAGFGPGGIILSVGDNTSTTFYARASNGGGGSGCSAGATYVEDSGSAPPPPPTAKKTANVEAKSGTVLVKCPGKAQSKLEGAEQIKLGCRIDATDGVVTLSTKDIKGKLQVADFFDGAFVVKQLQETETVKKKKVKVLITELTLSVAKPTGCKKTSKSSLGTAKRGGHLWGRGKGRYRTRGRRGSGAVRGTEWLTEERCEGTYFQVKTGVVEVKDFTLRKTVLLKKGKHYLAPAAKPKKK